MKRSWWRTGPPIRHTKPVLQPTMAQLLSQIAVLFAIAVVWGGGFLILLNATRSSNVAFVVETNTPAPRRTPTAISGTPTNAPIPIATNGATDLPAAVPTLSAGTTTAPTTPTATATATLTNTASTSVSYARDVQPIFDQICVKCHGGEKTQKNLVLKSFGDLMQGSEDGPVIEPGDPGNSLLIDMIVKGRMPKNGPKLLPTQIRVITDWVKEGAPNN